MQSDSIILNKVKGSNTVMLVVSIITLITVGGLVAFSSGPYWLAQLNGPTPVEQADLFLMDGTERLYNVEVSGFDMEDTYYYEETYDEDTGRQISIDAYFGALEVGKDYWILVRSTEEINTRQEDYIGTLQPITDSIAQDVLALSADELNIDYLPIMLDTTGDETGWYIGTAILAIVALIALWLGFSAIQRNNDPHKHPIMKKLARLGNVDDIVHSVEKDLTSGEEQVGKLTLTRSYVINKSNYDVIPFESLAWVYKMVRKGKYNTKTYEAHLFDVSGHKMTVTAKEDQVNAMLQAVATRAPWTIAGFSDDIKRTWEKDRQAFLSEVDKRRRDYKQQS